MARPLRAQYKGAFYHIMARGQRAESIFKTDDDRKQFLERLEITISKYNLHLHAFCLMDNHYHLLLETPEANLSQAMRYLNGSYANYFRSKHRLIGSIFQGRYKSIIVEKEDYLLHLSAYIHLNPVRAKIIKKPEQYKWSSYQYYYFSKEVPEWLYIDEIAKYGDNYFHIVSEILGMSKKEIDEMFVTRKTIMGSDALVTHVLNVAEERKGVDSDVELPEYVRLKQVTKEKVFSVVQSAFHISMEKILERTRGNVYRKLVIYALKRYTGLKLKEIGEIFGLKYHAVSSHAKQFEDMVKTNDELKRMKVVVDEKLVNRLS